MSLYNDVRPTLLSEVVGQSAQIKALEAHIDNDTLPHVVLFSGSSGTGKTTTARILAKLLGSMDIREINASEQRGIDFVRDLIEDIRYSSVTPIVYILDEFDAVTTDGQKALKKVFEDFPSYVYFFMCTTNPAKIIRDIHTRSTKIEFNPLTKDEICDIVRSTASKYERRIPRHIVELIAEKSEGSARLALVDLEKVMYLEPDEMEEAIGTVAEESKEVIDLCRALVKRDWNETREAIQGIPTNDWESVRYAVLGYASSTVLKSSSKQAALVLEFFKEPLYNSGKAGLVYAAYMAVHMN